MPVFIKKIVCLLCKHKPTPVTVHQSDVALPKPNKQEKRFAKL